MGALALHVKGTGTSVFSSCFWSQITWVQIQFLPDLHFLIPGLPTQQLTLWKDEDGQLAFILHMLGQPAEERNGGEGQTASRPSPSIHLCQYPV